MTILVTGGAGFIGANFVHDWLKLSDETVINLDQLTYAGNRSNLQDIADDPRHTFVHGSIADRDLVASLLRQHDARAIIHFAAETHVDRAIANPAIFFETNVLGTSHLLETSRRYFEGLAAAERAAFRFIHVSTDEVYGSLGPGDGDFTEESPYRPNNPYAASKAAADHAARAYGKSYGLPVIVTNSSNNYGPRQYPEKLIPLVITRALAGEGLPIYGSGKQIRDWLHVADHCAALRAVLAAGRPGESYNIGGGTQLSNLTVVHAICILLDHMRPRRDGRAYAEQVMHVADRPGHDERYGIDASKLARELGWRPTRNFRTGLEATVTWHLAGSGAKSTSTRPARPEPVAAQFA